MAPARKGSRRLIFRFRVLGSGSTGNATLVEGGGLRVLVDAGLGPRQLKERLASAGSGSGLRSTSCSSPTSTATTLGGPRRSSRSGACRSRAPVGPGRPRASGPRSCRATRGSSPGRRFASASSSSARWPCPTTRRAPVAFVLTAGGRLLRSRHRSGPREPGSSSNAFRGCHAVLLESNYDPAMLRDGPYPWALKERILGPLGHLSNGDVGRYLERGLGEECRQVVLAHLSQKNNHPELALLRRRRRRFGARGEMRGRPHRRCCRGNRLDERPEGARPPRFGGRSASAVLTGGVLRSKGDGASSPSPPPPLVLACLGCRSPGSGQDVEDVSAEHVDPVVLTPGEAPRPGALRLASGVPEGRPLRRLRPAVVERGSTGRRRDQPCRGHPRPL